MKQETNVNPGSLDSKHTANLSIIYFFAFLILLISFVCYGQENASYNSEQHNSSLQLADLTLKDGSETIPLFIADISKAQANYKKEVLRYMLKKSIDYQQPVLSRIVNQTSQPQRVQFKQFSSKTQSENNVISEIAKFNISYSISAFKESETNFSGFKSKTGVQLTLIKIIF